MDPDLVRLLLVVLGVLLVAGIYLWDRYKRGLASRPPRRVRERPDDETPVETFSLDDPPAAPDPLPDPVPAGAAGTGSEAPQPPPDPPAAAAPTRARPSRRAADGDPQFSMDLSFDAHGDGDHPQRDPVLEGEVERKIIVINLAARSGLFSGAAIGSACARVGLAPGDMSIYHYRDPASGKVLFSMASMVEPGGFPVDDMQGFTTPGLTLFTQLPGPRDGLSVYNDMLAIAEQLAALLKGELRDERHNKLTRQMQEHTRESIIEHRRRIQLARSRH